MQRFRGIKSFGYHLANSKSFKTLSSNTISQIPTKSFVPFSRSQGERRTRVRFFNKHKPFSTVSATLGEEAMADDDNYSNSGSGLLEAVNDLHGGVTVEVKEPMSPQTFATLLKASMSHWRQREKRGVWIKLSIDHSDLVDIAVKEGFKYHHAEADYLMLTYWIPETADTLPLNASHRVGLGAFVMNQRREVLVVQEQSGVFKGSGVWKYPTGVVNEGEDICTAAIREVKEETGIDTEFIEVLAFRQSHKSFFTKSDLFFVCMLKPLSFDIQAQAIEIEEAKWMPVEEYAAQPFNQKNELFKLVSKICTAKVETDYVGFAPYLTTTSSGKKSYLYFNNRFIDHIVTPDNQ